MHFFKCLVLLIDIKVQRTLGQFGHLKKEFSQTLGCIRLQKMFRNLGPSLSIAIFITEQYLA